MCNKAFTHSVECRINSFHTVSFLELRITASQKEKRIKVDFQGIIEDYKTKKQI